MTDFNDDVCIVMAGHRRSLGEYERQVYMESRMRLLARGNALMEHRAAKLQLDVAQENLSRIEEEIVLSADNK